MFLIGVERTLGWQFPVAFYPHVRELAMVFGVLLFKECFSIV
jgi:hypothetical protein